MIRLCFTRNPTAGRIAISNKRRLLREQTYSKRRKYARIEINWAKASLCRLCINGFVRALVAIRKRNDRLVVIHNILPRNCCLKELISISLRQQKDATTAASRLKTTWIIRYLGIYIAFPNGRASKYVRICVPGV